MNWLIFMVNVGKYIIQGSYGYGFPKINVTLPYPIGEMTIFSYSDTVDG